MVDLDVLFPQERDVTEWIRRHQFGEVPGRWPYGLHELADPADPTLRVQLRHLPAPGRLDRGRGRLQARLPRRLASASKLGLDRREAGLAWDENMALRMAQLAHYEHTYAGVIWATDQRPAGQMLRVLERLTATWVLSSAQQEPLRALLPGVPVHYVPFGVDTEFFSPSSVPSEPLIFSVGGDRDRDPETTAEAFRLVVEARPQVRALMQTPRDLQVAPEVEVVKHLTHTELREMYRQASVVAIATRPNLHVSGMTVSLEAMACGTPVVATTSPGFDDYVVDGRTGVLVSGGEPGALAERIINLLGDASAAQRMGEAGRAFVAEKRSTQRLCQRLRAIVTGQAPE